MSAHDLVARHAIRNTLARHSRGVDRADYGLLAGAYHDDATVDYGFFSGPAATLAKILAGAQAAAPLSLHRTSNISIRVSGARAVSESYVIAHAAEPAGPGPGLQRLVLGRYLDTHECRDGAWKITHRRYVIEGNCNRELAIHGAPPATGLAHFAPQGGKQAADPGTALLALHRAAARATTHPSGDARMTESSRAAAPAQDPSAALAGALAEALAREEIHQLVMAYCRGVDRADEELLASLFTPDAVVVTGVVNGSGAEFARAITAFVREEAGLCFHSVANEWIEVSGDEAIGEHYAIAHMVKDGEDMMTGGRYIDRYRRAGGAWKIASRTFVTDWNTVTPSTLQRDGFYAALTTWGRKDRSDPVYALWGSI